MSDKLNRKGSVALTLGELYYIQNAVDSVWFFDDVRAWAPKDRAAHARIWAKLEELERALLREQAADAEEGGE